MVYSHWTLSMLESFFIHFMSHVPLVYHMHLGELHLLICFINIYMNWTHKIHTLSG